MTSYPVILNGDHAEFEQKWAGNDPKNRPDWPLPSFDARDWAEAFCKINLGIDDDIMLGWFANALMRGFDEHGARTQLAKRPVAWRVNDPDNGWVIFEKEDAANRCSETCGGEMQGLYVLRAPPGEGQHD